MATLKSLSIPCVADFTILCQDSHLIDVEVGPRQELYALALAAVPDYREIQPGASFAKLKSETPHDFVVMCVDGSEVERVEIRGEFWNFHSIQPLPEGELLLYCGRCRRYDNGTHDRNARVYDSAGGFRRDFLLGDGINRVQTTADGRIWVGYFDEGVFGNYGWTEPIGGAGLVCWDATGESIYEYVPPAGMDSICDCYALNVTADDEIWLYYYTEFPLVRLRRNGDASVWRSQLGGSDAFAIHNGFVLFRGGYNQRDTYQLFELGNEGLMTQRSLLAFTDDSGARLQNVHAFARGPFLYLRDGLRCYRADVRELV